MRSRGALWPACQEELEQPHWFSAKQYCGAVPFESELARLEKHLALPQNSAARGGRKRAEVGARPRAPRPTDPRRASRESHSERVGGARAAERHVTRRRGPLAEVVCALA